METSATDALPSLAGLCLRKLAQEAQCQERGPSVPDPDVGVRWVPEYRRILISLEKDTRILCLPENSAPEELKTYRKWLSLCGYLDLKESVLNMQVMKAKLHLFLKSTISFKPTKCKYTGKYAATTEQITYEHIVPKDWLRATMCVQEFANVENDPFNYTLILKEENSSRGTKVHDLRKRRKKAPATTELLYAPEGMNPKRQGAVARATLYMFLTYPLLCLECSRLGQAIPAGMNSLSNLLRSYWEAALQPNSAAPWEVAYNKFILEETGCKNPLVAHIINNDPLQNAQIEDLKDLLEKRVQGTDAASIRLADLLNPVYAPYDCTKDGPPSSNVRRKRSSEP